MPTEVWTQDWHIWVNPFTPIAKRTYAGHRITITWLRVTHRQHPVCACVRIVYCCYYSKYTNCLSRWLSGRTFVEVCVMWPILNRTIVTPSRCVFRLKWHVSVMLTVVDLSCSDRPGYVLNRQVNTINTYYKQSTNQSLITSSRPTILRDKTGYLTTTRPHYVWFENNMFANLDYIGYSEGWRNLLMLYDIYQEQYCDNTEWPETIICRHCYTYFIMRHLQQLWLD